MAEANPKTEMVPVDLREMSLESLVYTIRGQQVMLDSDLATIYGYEVKRLNEQVKRNKERFPEDFMFRLTEDEIPISLRSQFATLNEDGNKRGAHLLSHKNPGVHVILFTENGFGRSRDRLTATEVTDFNNEYPTIQIKPNPDCHDRFIILDYGTKTEKAFHCGASSKDAGNKVCCINAIESIRLLQPIIVKLLQNPDKIL